MNTRGSAPAPRRCGCMQGSAPAPRQNLFEKRFWIPKTFIERVGLGVECFVLNYVNLNCLFYELENAEDVFDELRAVVVRGERLHTKSFSKLLGGDIVKKKISVCAKRVFGEVKHFSELLSR